MAGYANYHDSLKGQSPRKSLVLFPKKRLSIVKEQTVSPKL
jgi:hypothetical protein